MNKRTVLFSSVFFLGLFILQADAPQRDATQDEKKYYSEMMDLFGSIRPSYPEGWTESDRTEKNDLERVTEGTEEGPMSFEYQWTASNPALQQEYEMKKNEMIDQFQNNKPQELIDWEARQSALSNELVDASMRRDFIRQKQIQKELDELNRKIENYYDQQQNNGGGSHLPSPPQDTYVKLDIKVNSFSWNFSKEIEKESVEKGIIRIREGKEGWNDGNVWKQGATYLFLGPWSIADKNEEGADLTASLRRDIPHTRVQTIIIRIEGDKNRVRNILKSFQMDELKRKTDIDIF